jgi:hypothetical protein
MTKQKAIAPVEEQNVVAIEAPNPLQIINDAVAAGTDVAVIEKMFDLWERNEDRLAAQAFDRAMAKFQGLCPAIPKSKQADRFVYAPLEDIMTRIQPALTECGLSVRFDTRYEDDLHDGKVIGKYLIAQCHVAHANGHKETSEFKCPVDLENKTKITVAQQQGSANSYAKRYALSNALNLTFGGEDDDGQAAAVEYLTPEEVASVEAVVTEIGADKTLFLKWCKAPDGIEFIKRSQYSTVIDRLTQMRTEL